MISVTLNHDRSALHEGRVCGDGVSFGRWATPETLVSVSPLSTCKDYLNDVVAGEVTGCTIRAYGLKYKPDLENPLFKVNPVLLFTNYFYTSIPEGERIWYDPKLAAAMANMLEANYGVKGRTRVIYSDNEYTAPMEKNQLICGCYALELPKYWVRGQARISYITMMMRLVQGMPPHIKDVVHQGSLTKFITSVEAALLDQSCRGTLKKVDSSNIELPELLMYLKDDVEPPKYGLVQVSGSFDLPKREFVTITPKFIKEHVQKHTSDHSTLHNAGFYKHLVAWKFLKTAKSSVVDEATGVISIIHE